MAAEGARSVIAILLLICDLSFNKVDRKRITMATMDADADLYLGIQRPYQSIDNLYETFTVQVDTINSNRFSPGFHNGVYNKHMMELWDRDLVTADSLAAMRSANKLALENCLQKEAMESSCEEYLLCLLLLLADR